MHVLHLRGPGFGAVRGKLEAALDNQAGAAAPVLSDQGRGRRAWYNSWEDVPAGF
jgi:hypothetical protein